MPEVSDEQLALLQKSHEILQRLNGDDRARPFLEKSLKVIHPEVVTEEERREQLVKPALESFKEEVVAPLTAQLQKLTERETAEETRRVEQSLNEAFTDIRKNRHFTDEGIEAVKRLMVDRKIADPYAAAALFAEQNPKPVEASTSFAPQHWNMDQSLTDFDLEGLFKNEDAWADQMAGKALADVRQVNSIGVG